MPEQAERYEGDAWERAIVEYVSDKARILIDQTAKNALSLETGRISRADQNRIMAILTAIGWVRGPRGAKGERFWVRGPEHSTDALTDPDGPAYSGLPERVFYDLYSVSVRVRQSVSKCYTGIPLPQFRCNARETPQLTAKRAAKPNEAKD